MKNKMLGLLLACLLGLSPTVVRAQDYFAQFEALCQYSDMLPRYRVVCLFAFLPFVIAPLITPPEPSTPIPPANSYHITISAPSQVEKLTDDTGSGTALVRLHYAVTNQQCFDAFGVRVYLDDGGVRQGWTQSIKQLIVGSDETTIDIAVIDVDSWYLASGVWQTGVFSCQVLDTKGATEQ